MFGYLSLEERVRKDHPLRAVRSMKDSILRCFNVIHKKNPKEPLKNSPRRMVIG
jgi:hypothetical protein